MRDYSSVIEALERKAADAAVSVAEREALYAKAAELRERYQPVTQTSAPPPRPPPPRPPAPPASAMYPMWSNGPMNAATNTMNTTTWVRIFTVRIT